MSGSGILSVDVQVSRDGNTDPLYIGDRIDVALYLRDGGATAGTVTLEIDPRVDPGGGFVWWELVSFTAPFGMVFIPEFDTTGQSRLPSAGFLRATGAGLDGSPVLWVVGRQP